MKYRSLPVVFEIEAIQWTGDNLREIIDFTGLHPSAEIWTWAQYEQIVAAHGLKIFTGAGSVVAKVGSFIIKRGGEFYPCPPDVFATKYEPIEETENAET